MNAMTSLDFIIARKYLAQEAAITIPIGIIVSFLIGNIYTMPTAFAAMIPVVLGFTLFTLDEKGKWEEFRLALPLSRTDVITGRYLTYALLAIAGIVIGLATYALTLAIASLAPSLPNASALASDTEITFAIAAPCIGALAGLVMLAVVTPIVARFGMTKAVRFVPAVMALAVCFGLALAGATGAAASIETAIIEAFSSPEGTAAFILAVVVATAAGYTVSCAIACRLYQHREL